MSRVRTNIEIEDSYVQAIMERSEARYTREGGLSTKQVRARLAARPKGGRRVR